MALQLVVPQGNGQCEKYNGTIWKAVQAALKSRNLPLTHLEVVLQDALHSIRSLLCTSINCTPHERMFSHARRSVNGTTIPSWLKPGPIYVKPVLLNLFHVAAHFSPRLCFVAHFTKNLIAFNRVFMVIADWF